MSKAWTLTTAKQFVTKWYLEGIVMTPIVCMSNRKCYRFTSDNLFCKKFGQSGLKWAESNRSRIMFIAFWVSFATQLLLMLALCSASFDSGTVKNLPYFTVKVNYINSTEVQGSNIASALIRASTYDNRNEDAVLGVKNGNSSAVNVRFDLSATPLDTTTVKQINSYDVHFYAGVGMIVSECRTDTSSTYCPDRIKHWSDVRCTRYWSSCQSCYDSSGSTFSQMLSSFMLQTLSMMSNLQRSTARGDLHCEKFWGVLDGIIGLLQTIAALNVFTNNCFNKIESSVYGVTIHKTLGAAFYCLLLSTFLKLFDIVSHVVVPVPAEGYWGQHMLVETDDVETVSTAKIVLIT